MDGLSVTEGDFTPCGGSRGRLIAGHGAEFVIRGAPSIIRVDAIVDFGIWPLIHDSQTVVHDTARVTHTSAIVKHDAHRPNPGLTALTVERSGGLSRN
jgi:hypothetical protein